MLDSDDAIAVVGLAVRAGAAATVEQFWLDLIRGPGPAGSAGPIDGGAGRSLFRDVTHAAVENAGYDPATIGPGAGVYAATDSASPIAEDAAHHLDLHGPSLTILSTGPGALVAVHTAGRSLHVGDCDVAIAGGVFEPAGAACAVVVKRMADALTDRDRIRAVIRGSAVTGAGADRAGPAALTAAVLEAMATAGVSPADLSYVETDAGSAAEPAALTAAYTRLSGRPPQRGRCGLGSVRGAVGDLGPVTGLAALIKVVLALDHEQLPAGAAPDALGDATFRPQDRLGPWPRDPRRPRVAAVGWSGAGTHVHVVLAEAPEQPPTMHHEQPRVVLWSGHRAADERVVRDRLAQYFVWRGEEVFADAVATLQHGRARHAVRAAAVCTGSLDAAAALGSADAARVHTGTGPVTEPRPVAFFFPGTGAAGAAARLHRDVPAFARRLDGWFDRLDAPDLPVRQRWRDGADDPAVLFAVAASLAEVWVAAGVRPVAVLGDGIGVLAAAVTAGRLRPDEAAARARAWVLGRPAPETTPAGPASAIPVHATAGPPGGADLAPAPAAPERVAQAARALPAGCLLVEVGPAQTVPAALASVPAHDAPLLAVAARLWTEGHDIDWETVGQPPLRRRIDLPAYPYPPAPAGSPPVLPLAVAARAVRPSAARCSFTVLRQPGPGPLVLALPYAGGSGRALQSIRHHVPDGCGFALVDLPGHGVRMGRPCLRDADAVVDVLVDALPTLPSRRLVIFGYSLGGSLAYELAARLAEAGTPPEGVVICGTRAPQTGIGHPPIAQLTDGGSFLRAAVAMGLAAREMIELPELADWCAGPLQADLSMVERLPFRTRRAPLGVPAAIIGMHSDWLVPEPSLRAWDDLFLRPPRQWRVAGGHLAVHEREREFGATVAVALDHVLAPAAAVTGGPGTSPSVLQEGVP